MTDANTHKRAAAVRERLAALEDERRSLQNELVSLERRVPLSGAMAHASGTACFAPRLRKLRFSAVCLLVAATCFRCAGTIQERPSPDMLRHARTSGSRVSAESRR